MRTPLQILSFQKTENEWHSIQKIIKFSLLAKSPSGYYEVLFFGLNYSIIYMKIENGLQA